MTKKIRTWKKGYSLIIAALFTITGAILFVLYSYREGIQVLSFFMVLSFPICLHMLYLEYRPDKWYGRLLNGLIMFVMVGPLVFGLFRLQERYIEDQLARYPVDVWAQVTGYESRRSKGRTTHYAVFRYTVSGKQFEQKVANDNDKYQFADSLQLTVSGQHPEIWMITMIRRKFPKALPE